MTRGVAAGLASLAALALLAGCGGDKSVEPAQPAKPSEPSAAAKEALEDPESAASTVVTYWRYLENGALPAALALYDPRVTQSVGVATWGGMLAGQQQQAAELELNVLDIEEIAGGTLVLAELVPDVGAKSPASFFLRQTRGRWLIVYDTFSAGGLVSFAQQYEQRQVEPYAEELSGRALTAGDRVAAAYRTAALTPPRRGAGATATAPAGTEDETATTGTETETTETGTTETDTETTP
jgi:hypothetical protein